MSSSPILPRVHWLEIHEQWWCPPYLRTYLQDLLRWVWETLGLVDSVVPILAKALDETNATHVVDLCSGGGGPHAMLLPALQRELGGREVKMTLTDLYPNLEAWKLLSASTSGLTYVKDSVDATRVPKDLGLKGFRTLFTCLHHFGPDMVQSLLQDAVSNGEGVAVFEITDRNLISVLFGIVTIPLMGIWHALTHRPFSIVYFLLGTFLPLGTLLNFHDGTTSNLRTYSVDELEAVVAKLKGSEEYTWEIGRRRSSPLTPNFMRAPYVVGIPINKGKGLRSRE